MRRGLDCTFDSDFPVTVGWPTGVLSIASAAVLRGLVLKALTGAADLVVLDVSRLRVHEDIALAVFPALTKQAAASWGAALRICAPGPAFAEALDRMAVCRYVPVHRSATQAIRAHERRPAPVRLHHAMLPVPSAPAAGREAVLRACAAWRLAHLVPPASAVATELITNAVVHARTRIDFSVGLRARYLHLAVRDERPTLPRRRRPEPRAGAHGLDLVDRLCVSWGSHVTHTGKVVWATMALPAGR